MLVDDHQIITDGISSLLEDIPGIKVVAAARDGMEAIGLLNEVDVDVILMDIQMPVMNGWETTGAVMKDCPHIKIIALTTFDERSIVQKMIQAGAKGYILKNINKDKLVEAIVAVHHGETYFSGEIQVALETLNPRNEISKPPDAILNSLSTKEIQILKLIANGYTNKEMGEMLHISAKTVDNHRTHIMQKLDMHNTSGLVRFAIQNGLVQ